MGGTNCTVKRKMGDEEKEVVDAAEIERRLAEITDRDMLGDDDEMVATLTKYEQQLHHTAPTPTTTTTTSSSSSSSSGIFTPSCTGSASPPVQHSPHSSSLSSSLALASSSVLSVPSPSPSPSLSVVPSLCVASNPSLLAQPNSKSELFVHPLFYKSMIKTHLCMSHCLNPFCFPFQLALLRRRGYNIFIPEIKAPSWVPAKNRLVIEKYTIPVGTIDQIYETSNSLLHNDLCIPAHTFIGVFLQALFKTDLFDPSQSAVIYAHSGGACRMSNYTTCCRKALVDSGHPEIPVFVLGTDPKYFDSPGFEYSSVMFMDILKAFFQGDLMMKLLYRTRPYEVVKDSANDLVLKLFDEGYRLWETGGANGDTFQKWTERAITQFEALPLRDDVRKPLVGIVGEMGVSMRPAMNGYLAEYLEQQGAEVTMSGWIHFLTYFTMNKVISHQLFRKAYREMFTSRFALWYTNYFMKPANKLLSKSKRFSPFNTIENMLGFIKPYCSPLCCWGEGWLLVAEIVDIITNHHCSNILLIQPWGCLCSHITGRGFMKMFREKFEGINLVPIDFDTSGSEVNQKNRITLMMTIAKDMLKKQMEREEREKEQKKAV